MSTLSLPHQIKVGAGSINQLRNAVLTCNASRPLIIMDNFLASEPLNMNLKVLKVLNKGNIEVDFFTDFSGEPQIEHVEGALMALKSFQADSVIAIGGGSAIDISKSVALFGVNSNLEWSNISSQTHLNKLPLIAVPTTSGTGSEATGIMVVSDPELGIKLNPGHPQLIPNIAILDPELTVSLPQHFTAFTGLDALTHAIEAYVSNRANLLTDSYAIKAIQMIGTSLPIVYHDGTNLIERQNMLLASCYAGIAFFNSSTNLAHAAGRALGNRFKIPHGLSVAVLLPFVMKFGLESSIDRYRDVAIALGADPSKNDLDLAHSAINIVDNFNKQFGVWDSLSEYIPNVTELNNSISLLAEDAMSGNGIETNRKVPSQQDIEKIFNSIANKLTNINMKTTI